jgi:predicted nucleotidyltransferase component of viral defense system
MSQLDLNNWVSEETDPQRRQFRRAVHLILRAIAASETLAPCMVMKGGILLAIRYNSPRFTRDVDFSTPQRFQEIHLPALLKDISDALAPVSGDNEYGLALALQSHAVKPPDRPEISFPTLQLKIGYANRASQGEMQRFTNKQSAKIVQLDYSFNEWASEIETQDVDGGILSMYAYHDLIAEKLRSVLQQPLRNRSRFQDIYDLCLLLEFATITEEDKQIILHKLHAASEERRVPMDGMAMRQQDIIDLSKRDYGEVAMLISTKPPAFDVAYGTVKAFFESLPWPADG